MVNQEDILYSDVIEVWDDLNSLVDMGDHTVSEMVEHIYSDILERLCVSRYNLKCEMELGEDIIVDIAFEYGSDKNVFDFFMGLVVLSFLNYYTTKKEEDI